MGTPVKVHCVRCGRYRNVLAKMMCSSCYLTEYRLAHKRTCVECGTVGVIRAKELCSACYQRARSKRAYRKGECVECGRHMRLHARRMCESCYRRSTSPYDKCAKCGQRRLLTRRNHTTCTTCYGHEEYLKHQQRKEPRS